MVLCRGGGEVQIRSSGYGGGPEGAVEPAGSRPAPFCNHASATVSALHLPSTLTALLQGCVHQIVGGLAWPLPPSSSQVAMVILL